MSINCTSGEVSSRYIFPFFYLSKYVLVLDDVFIGGYQDIKLAAAELRHETPTQTRSALKRERQDRKNNITAKKMTKKNLMK